MNALTLPGPGGWEIDATHFPRPPSLLAREVYTQSFTAGLAAGFVAMGTTLEAFQLREVDGFIYTQPKVVGAPAGGKTPPGPVLWLASRLHPGLRKRNARAADVWATRAWREEVARFAREEKPALVERHRALLAEPVDGLDDHALLDHLRRACEAWHRAAWVHGRYTIACHMPTGDFISQARAWTGRHAAELMRLVVGCAPISSGISAELSDLVSALAAGGRAAPRLDVDQPTETLDALVGLPAPVGPAARAWIDTVGWRTIQQYDAALPAVIEYPFLLVATLIAAVEGRLRPAEPDPAALAEVRDAVPEAHRETFDGLLAEAQALSALRDERTLYADCWAAGVARRALLAVGRRLVERGRLQHPTHACEASVEELAAALGGGGPGAEALAARARARGRSALEAPQVLGVLARQPDPSWFPAPTARTLRAVFTTIEAIFKDCENPSETEEIRGFPVSAGQYEGTARRVEGPEDFHRLQRGDVLVATMTSPVYNIVLPVLGAVVTDRGGALSHAAIVSREFGIPGVVGCRDATRRIPDGARVRVDGSAGTVTVLGAA